MMTPVLIPGASAIVGAAPFARRVHMNPAALNVGLLNPLS
jgi:hypothetical protein